MTILLTAVWRMSAWFTPVFIDKKCQGLSNSFVKTFYFRSVRCVRPLQVVEFWEKNLFKNIYCSWELFPFRAELIISGIMGD